jgi:hypothetical protein
VKSATISGTIIFAFLIVLALCCAVPQLFTAQNEDFEQDRVKGALVKYYKLGILDAEMFKDYKFILPLKDFQFDKAPPAKIAESLLLQGAGTQDEKQLESLTFSDYVRRIASIFVLGTPFEGKVHVNELPEGNYLNMYFAIEIRIILHLITPTTAYI